MMLMTGASGLTTPGSDLSTPDPVEGVIRGRSLGSRLSDKTLATESARKDDELPTPSSGFLGKPSFDFIP